MKRVCGIVVICLADTLGFTGVVSPAFGQTFSSLEPGFTQEIFGVSPHFMGGVAFAPDADLYVNDCRGGGSELHRFDLQVVGPPVHGTNLHPATTVPSNAGCGMANHQDGLIYSNTLFGAVQIDSSTGTPTGAVFGPPGNVLGIAPDPQTGDVVYVAANCRFTGTCDIITVDPDTNASSVFVSLPGLQFIDGIYFAPDGSQLFMSTRSPFYAVTVVDRDGPGLRTGTLNRHILLPSEPDGISFHSRGFLVTTNTDGTITKIVPGPPDTVSLFASGGFRSDLTQVGSDTCIYATQAGTRYNDGTVTAENSLVRICPGFVPPPGVKSCEIDIKPDSSVNPVNVSSKGVIPVAILGSASCDVREVGIASLRFGRGGAGEAHGLGHFADLNRDGVLDIMLHFGISKSGIRFGDAEACLHADLGSGSFSDCDKITTLRSAANG